MSRNQTYVGRGEREDYSRQRKQQVQGRGGKAARCGGETERNVGAGEQRVSSRSTQDMVERSMQDPDAEQSRKPQYGLGLCPEDNRMTLSV